MLAYTTKDFPAPAKSDIVPDDGNPVQGGVMKRLAALAVIAGFVLVGCGGGGGSSNSPAPVPPTVDVTGTWDVSITSTGGNQVPVGSHWTAIITTVQTGSSASGTFVTSGGGGQVSGSVSGDDLDMTIAQTSPCAGTYHGIGMVNAASNLMSGTYSGADCYGTLETSFTATKR